MSKMDFKFTTEQEKLRREVRQFLINELGKDWTGTWRIVSPDFSRKLAQRGWIGMAWPNEYGGAEASYLDRLVVTEELCRFGAPLAFHHLGDRQVGPALIRFGSEELKLEFLPRIIRAEIHIAALFSEPDAGSDLASVKCSAVEDGDEFVVNGRKIWSSHAHQADYGWLVSNTDAHGPRYKNITEFIVDLKKPGVSFRPILDVTGAHSFNETIFDDYRISRKYLVGHKNEGWRQIVAQVDFERSGIDSLMGNWGEFERVVDRLKESRTLDRALNGAILRDKLADLKVQLEVGRLLSYRVAWLLSQGKVPNFESAMARVYGTNFQKNLANVCADVLGLISLLRPESKRAPLQGIVGHRYLESPCYTIGGGASEILRNIIAVRGLGMPVY